jgi:hypothetical protein
MEGPLLTAAGPAAAAALQRPTQKITSMGFLKYLNTLFLSFNFPTFLRFINYAFSEQVSR